MFLCFFLLTAHIDVFPNDGCFTTLTQPRISETRFAGRGIQLSGRLEKIQEVALGRGAEAFRNAGGMDGWRCRDVGVMVMEICGVCFFLLWHGIKGT